MSYLRSRNVRQQSIKHKPDGTKYKDFFYYGEHRTMTRGHKCEYKANQ